MTGNILVILACLAGGVTSFHQSYTNPRSSLPVAPSRIGGNDGIHSTVESTTVLFGKKAARKSSGGGKPRGQQPVQEKQSLREARFDAMTRQFMFTMVGLTKILPDKSKTILKNIHLSFFPGAKIGVVGLNGSGKSTLLKIMAGLDTEYDGIARPLPGASIGYLSQEPVLPFETVKECIDEAVRSSQAILDQYNELSMKLGDPSLDPDEISNIMSKTDMLSNQIEAGNLWELDRIVSRAMDSLRVPPGEAKTATLSGGEKRRVALCRLLLANHDMLLLDGTWFIQSMPIFRHCPAYLISRFAHGALDIILIRTHKPSW